jgi:replicative DNA helicase
MTADTQVILQNYGQAKVKSEFGLNIEKAIISLAFDHPELFLSAGRHFSPNLFEGADAQFVMAMLLNAIAKHDIVPTRGIIRDQALAAFSVDDNYQGVLDIIDRKSDPRETPFVKEQLIQWLKKKSYGLIYGPEAIAAFELNDFDKLEKIFEEARKITDFHNKGIWLLNDYTKLYEENIIEHRTTGFPRLDAFLNNGGPSPGEVLCWLAGTNVGKSIMLCNNAITSWMGPGQDGRIGQDVLLVTFELDYIKTAMRCLGALTKNIPLNTLVEQQHVVTQRIEEAKANYDGRIYISELPPESCTIDDIHSLIDNLKKTKGWTPNVVIVDYMDLMLSRNKKYNDDNYERQRSVASELRAFAKKEHVLVFTATQTNRNPKDAQDGAVIDLSRAADSYAKQFSMDYIIGIIQSAAERAMTPAQVRFTIAKNRNGPRNEIIPCQINYDTMYARELNT